MCPRNGEWTQCLSCDFGLHAHQREELVREGAKTPRCETHDLKLRKAD